MNDNIKIEINYSLRAHIFAPEKRSIVTDAIPSGRYVLSVLPIEIFAGKINALLSRAAARDLYDTYNMIRYGLFRKSEYDLLRKSIIFYTAISQEEIPQLYDMNRIDAITAHKIKTDLLPVIHKGEYVELENMKNTVKGFIEKLLLLTDDEKAFLMAFSEKQFKPELLFDDSDILNRIRQHPMASAYVLDASPTIVHFSATFKKQFWEAFIDGKKPRAIIKDSDLRQSMSRKANCWDNAPQESFFGHMKDEIDISRCKTYGEVLQVATDWTDYYNNDRYQWDLAKLSPIQYYQYTMTGVYPLIIPKPKGGV